MLEPPDGEWLVDEEGRKYYTFELEKIEGAYRKLDDGRVLLPHGLRFHIAEETEDTFVLKVFKVAEVPAPEGKKEDREEILASYHVETPEVDRLRFDRELLGSRAQWRQGFELADMNEDGHLDIVHSPPRKSDGVPRIFLGDGEGGWEPWKITLEGESLDYGGVAVADFDGDAHLDIAIGVHLRGVRILFGDGNGRFRPGGEGLEYRVPGKGPLPEYSTRTVTAVDWNRDGRPDLLTLGEGPRLLRSGRRGSERPEFDRGSQGPVLFLNLGERRFQRYDQGTGRRMVFGDDLAAADLDEDGALDFVTASSIRGYDKILHWGVEGRAWEVASLEGLRPAVIGGVEIDDFDGDGHLDLAVAYAAREVGEAFTGVDLFLGDGDRHWTRVPAASLEDGHDAIRSLAVGDLDGDGRPDLVGLTASGVRAVWLNRGDGRFLRERSPELSTPEIGCRGYGVEIATLEDGDPRVIAGFAGEPGSEQVIPGRPPSCPSRGSLEVWSPSGSPSP